jgi:hypothetical protein
LRVRRVVERLRVEAGFAALDLRAVGAFRVLAAFVPDFARVVDAFRRVVDAFRRVVDRRVPVLAAADFRVAAAFVADDDFRRGFAFVADDFARDVAPAEVDLRVVVDFLRLVVLDEPRSVNRLVRPARTVVAFSSCATPFATSSCARATALSTGPSPERFVERFDRLVFLAAIAFLPCLCATPCAAVWSAVQVMWDYTLLTHETPHGDAPCAS